MTSFAQVPCLGEAKDFLEAAAVDGAGSARPLVSVLRTLMSVLRPLVSVLRTLVSVLRPLVSVLLRPLMSVLRPLMIPCVVLYVALQRYYIRGLTSGVVKG